MDQAADTPPPARVIGPGELDVLSVLWAEQAQGGQPLKLTEVHRRVCDRRQRRGESEPALTTVSGYLHDLVEQGLVQEEGAALHRTSRSRGRLTAPGRTQVGGYRAVQGGPAVVLASTYRALAAAYPPGQQLQAVVDLGRALGLPDKVLLKLNALLHSTPSP